MIPVWNSTTINPAYCPCNYDILVFFIVMQDNGKADGIHREIYQENGCKPTLVETMVYAIYALSEQTSRLKYKLVCAVYIIMIQHNNLR